MASKNDKSTTAGSASPPRRRRGRPSAHKNGLLDSKLIIACAFELSKSVPLQELSIVRVATELGVTPALIHYYLAGRDALTSGVMNSFYREMLLGWPVPRDHWRENLEVVADHVYHTYVAYPGVAAYAVAHNRFRLAQIVGEGETDHGIELFERFVGVVREIGFDARRTGMYANLVMEFITSGAYATVRHRWPSEHSDFLEQIFARLDPKEYPNIRFVRKNYIRSSGHGAFKDGMTLVLGGLELELAKLSDATQKP